MLSIVANRKKLYFSLGAFSGIEKMTPQFLATFEKRDL